LHLARVNSSPLWIAQSNHGSLFYGSTQQTVENAAVMTDSEIDWLYEAKEGEYFKVKDGHITEYQTFTPRTYERASYWAKYTNGTATTPTYQTELDYLGKYNQRKADKYAKWWEQHDELMDF